MPSDNTGAEEGLMFERDDAHRKKLKCDMASEELNSRNILKKPIFADSFKTITSQFLHEILVELDADSASMFHPNERRKIIRALQVQQRAGRKYSEFLKDQRETQGGSAYGGPLSSRKSLIFWLRSDKQSNLVIFTQPIINIFFGFKFWIRDSIAE